MQTQDVLGRLKRATADRVPTTDSSDRRRANGRLVVGVGTAGATASKRSSTAGT